MKRILIGLIVIVMLCCATTGCNKHVKAKPVKGTMEALVGPDSVPETVAATLQEAMQGPLDERFEVIMEDKKNNVSVWGLVKCSDTESSQGYGVIVVKDNHKTPLNIRHGNMPKAYYNKASGDLWFTGAVVEGTGVHVERPYLMKFDENGKAEVVASIDPYEMQQELLKRISYSIDGQEITIYANKKPLATVKNTVKDRGDFFDDPVWIGEQLTYHHVGKRRSVHFIPGLCFTVGKVLIYDDMPTIAANVELTPEGFSLKDFRIVRKYTTPINHISKNYIK